LQGELATYKDADLSVLVVLAAHADRRDGTCFPGLERIAKLAGVRKATISTATGRLEMQGRLTVTHKAEARGAGYRVNLAGEPRSQVCIWHAMVHTGLWASLTPASRKLYLWAQAVSWQEDEGGQESTKTRFIKSSVVLPVTIAKLIGVTERTYRRALAQLKATGLVQVEVDGEWRLPRPLVGHQGTDSGHQGTDGGHEGTDGGHEGTDGGHEGTDGADIPEPQNGHFGLAKRTPGNPNYVLNNLINNNPPLTPPSGEVLSEGRDVVVFKLPCLGGEGYEVKATDLDSLQQAHATLNLDAEFRGMLGWLTDNPGRHKAPAGMPRFINNWLRRSEGDRGRRDRLPKPLSAKEREAQRYQADNPDLFGEAL